MLIVEDDERLTRCLARAIEAPKVMTAGSLSDALAQIELCAPDYAVVDMRLGDGCGLDVISTLRRLRPEARSVILTGYGKYRHRRKSNQTWRLRLSQQACGRRRYRFCAARAAW
jgi:ActR/RegA family two-component response regulator